MRVPERKVLSSWYLGEGEGICCEFLFEDADSFSRAEEKVSLTSRAPRLGRIGARGTRAAASSRYETLTLEKLQTRSASGV